MDSWIYLIIAGIFEMMWVLALKFSENFTKVLFLILTVIFMILSLIFLSLSFKTIPIGTAYACWTAIGTVGVIIISLIFFKETMSILRFFFIAIIIIGVIGLKLT